MNTSARSSSVGSAETVRSRILVVGYTHACRYIFTTILTTSGYEISTAVDGVEALRRLAVEPFDLILTDWKLPIFDGGNLVLALRSRGIPTPVVILSGELPDSPALQAIATEVFAVLTMPINPPVLISAVSAALRARQDDNQPYVHSIPSSSPEASLPKTILVVDDDEAVRSGLRCLLVTEGYEVITAINGFQAVAAFRRKPCDLALIDMNMPLQNGWGAIASLRALAAALPIVIITARPDQRTVAREAGVELMEKPLDPPLLLRRIGEMLLPPAGPVGARPQETQAG